MSLGKNYGNNKNEEVKSPQTYSYYKWTNPTSSIDPTALNIRFWRGLVVIGIAPKKDGGEGEFINYDYTNPIECHVTHTKARILANEIKKYLRGDITSGGIQTRRGLINICNGEEFGHPESTCLVVRIISDTGEVSASACYEFKMNFHNAIENFNETTKKFDTRVYPELEIEELLSLLEQYYLAMTNAVAYSVIDSGRFIQNNTYNSLVAIKDSLGIKGSGSSGGRSYGSNSFFNSNKAGSSTSSPTEVSFDDLSKELDA